MRIAAVDIGTNSTRLLVADVVGGEITEQLRRSVVTRLGDGVDQTGQLNDAACERVLTVLREFRAQIDELAALGAEVQLIIKAAVPPEMRALAKRAVAVAGTPTALAAVDLQLEKFDPWKVHGHVLSLETVEALLAQLAALPLAQRKNVTGLHPDRAGTIVAGAAILLASMHSFGLTAVQVSEHDILYGLLLRAAARPS